MNKRVLGRDLAIGVGCGVLGILLAVFGIHVEATDSFVDFRIVPPIITALFIGPLAGIVAGAVAAVGRLALPLFGVGAVLSQSMEDGALEIKEVMKGGPMAREGSIKEGDKIMIKLLEVDPKTGKFRLSARALKEKPEGYVEPERPARPARGDRGPRPERRGPRPEHRDHDFEGDGAKLERH